MQTEKTKTCIEPECENEFVTRQGAQVRCAPCQKEKRKRDNRENAKKYRKSPHGRKAINKYQRKWYRKNLEENRKKNREYQKKLRETSEAHREYCRNYYREYMRTYSQSESYKANRRKYKQTPEYKAAERDRRYRGRPGRVPGPRPLGQDGHDLIAVIVNKSLGIEMDYKDVATLIGQAQQGSDEAKKKVIELYSSDVMDLAMQHKKWAAYDNKNDVFQEAMVAFIGCIDLFDMEGEEEFFDWAKPHLLEVIGEYRGDFSPWGSVSLDSFDEETEHRRQRLEYDMLDSM